MGAFSHESGVKQPSEWNVLAWAGLDPDGIDEVSKMGCLEECPEKMVQLRRLVYIYLVQ